MTIEQFNQLYGHKGGFKLLNEFREEMMTLKYIGSHFGVDRQRVSQWMRELYGVNYDPRETRREKILHSMIGFAKKHSLEEFRDAYYYISKNYYDLALQECYNQDIFSKEEKNEVQLPRTREEQEAQH